MLLPTHFRLAVILGIACGFTVPLYAAETSERYGIVGLFGAERQQDLRDVIKEVPEVQLVAMDVDSAEVTFRYDPAKLFPNFNPKNPPSAEQTLQRLNNLISQAALGSFRIVPCSKVPKDALTKVEIDIGVLDCKACRYGAYRAVMGVDGVARATVSATPSRITAWIDAKKADRAALERALKRVGVEIPSK